MQKEWKTTVLKKNISFECQRARGKIKFLRLEMLKVCLQFCSAFHLNAVLFQYELGFITANSAKDNDLIGS